MDEKEMEKRLKQSLEPLEERMQRALQDPVKEAINQMTEALEAQKRLFGVVDDASYLQDQSAFLDKYAFVASPRLTTLDHAISTHTDNSSEELIRTLEAAYNDWSEELTSDLQVSILAILANGARVEVLSMRSAGQNGIVINGRMEEKPSVLLMHQAGFQFICLAEQVTEEKPRRKIGFIYGQDAQGPPPAS